MLKKLRIKFVCINMSIISVMLAVIFFMVIHFTGQNLEQTSLQRMEELAVSPIHPGNPPDPSASSLPYFTLLIGKNGNLLDSYSGYYDLSDRSLLETIVNTVSGMEGKTGILKDYQLRFLRLTLPSGQYIIFADASSELSTMENLTRNCLLIGALSFAVFLGISIYLANWAIKPVDLAWEQQKQFIADASHELKTPLTVILTNGELLKSPDYPAEKKEQFSHNIVTMARQMRSLVEGLLELSRIDNHSMRTLMEPFNLSELTMERLCLFEPLYYEAGLTCNSQIFPNIKIKGSASHLKQVLDILLDNGLKYANPCSQIRVTLEKEKRHVLLTVKTAGDPLSPKELKKIFQRFYRADQSRSNSGSYGLGLSIAESIVREHDGKIWAESKNGINSFYIKLSTWEK